MRLPGVELMEEIRIETTQMAIISFCELAQKALTAINRIMGSVKGGTPQILTIRQVGDLICLGVAAARETGFITIVELPIGVLDDGADE